MICPACGVELSRIWQTVPTLSNAAISKLQWRCGTCGSVFTNAEVNMSQRKRRAQIRKAYNAQMRTERQQRSVVERRSHQPKQQDN